MITEEEKTEIIDRAVEKALLMLPEVVGNLMMEHTALAKINKEFYAKFPEFKDKKDVVTAVIEMMEGQNPLEKYEDILSKSIPEIRKRLQTTQGLDMAKISRPSLDLSHGEI